MNKALDTLYEELDFQSGSLLPTTEEPNAGIGDDDWLEKGEWLAAGKRAGAEKIFFVENNPVAVFAECPSDDPEEKARAFNRIWSLARPRLLFLASPGEIGVWDLAQKPLNVLQMKQARRKKRRELQTLATLREIEKVGKELQEFHRDNIESNRLFAESRFGGLGNRADKALIRDLKTVRLELIRTDLSGENLRFAHALIGRSIFIRYLEDRGILTRDYFLEVAAQNPEWTRLLETQPSRPRLDAPDHHALYPCVLANKDFTYALFKSLAHDFNGDMFPDVNEEEQTVAQEHLSLIQGLLYGDVGVQKRLFFYCYRFDIVPIDLISSIYEEFYHSPATIPKEKTNARQDGAFYTPSVLVELALSRTLTARELKKNPRVLDPACGSGSFLVESFRRIVRYRWHRNRRRLTFVDLKRILRDQITGIEVNEEAARITAFSLYLAMLHYLEPPAITGHIERGNRLPNLLVSEIESENHYHTIWVGNAFDTRSINSSPVLLSRFGEGCADIVVGNPPWGAVGTGADRATKEREKVMLQWCKVNDKPIGDKEQSQAFLWRSLAFLREGGTAGMLVSAGVLFKHSTTSLSFREQWMDSAKINEVFNFTHVRRFFFKKAISPFLLICFEKAKQSLCAVKYWSAKEVMALEKTQAIVFSNQDVHTLREEYLPSGQLWKTYWFGRLADANLVKQLQIRPRVRDFLFRERSGLGYKVATKDFSAQKLARFQDVDVRSFSRYDQLKFGSPPERVHAFGIIDAYSGRRLLIKRGISQGGKTPGRIIARFEEKDFCFRNSIHGLKLKSGETWRYKAFLGILWSSLCRYYFFLTSSTWGLWHHEIHLEEILDLPVVLEKGNPLTDRIIAVVDKLRSYHPQKLDLHHPDGVPEQEIEAQREAWEADLDDAVFALYGLNDEQKDLIRDGCEVALPFFYRPLESGGTQPAVQREELSWIETYARIFSRRWNAYLDDGVEMRAALHVGAHDRMIALEFFPADEKDEWDLVPNSDTWGYVLEQIGNTLPQPMGVSRILMDGVIHVVSDDAVIVIKRNERRFWTRSLAREDADSTLCKRMMMPSAEVGGQG